MKLLGKGDKLDKYRAHIIDGAELDQEQQLMLQRYRMASALMCAGYSRMKTINAMKDDTGLSESQLYAIIRDSIKLFGSVNDVDKAGMKYIMYENFMNAGDIARMEGDYKSMVRAYENASRLYDLFSPDTHLIDPREFLRPMAIVYSTDPAVLEEQQKQQNQDIEDIDYSDYEEEGT